MPIVPQERTGISMDVPMAQVNPSQYGGQAAALSRFGEQLAESSMQLYQMVGEEQAISSSAEKSTFRRNEADEHLKNIAMTSPDGYAYLEDVDKKTGEIISRPTGLTISEYSKEYLKRNMDSDMADLPSNRARELYKNTMTPFALEYSEKALTHEMTGKNKYAVNTLDRISFDNENYLRRNPDSNQWATRARDMELLVLNQVKAKSLPATSAQPAILKVKADSAYATLDGKLSVIKKGKNLDSFDGELKNLEREILRNPIGKALDPDRLGSLLDEIRNTKKAKKDSRLGRINQMISDTTWLNSEGKYAQAQEMQPELNKLMQAELDNAETPEEKADVAAKIGEWVKYQNANAAMIPLHGPGMVGKPATQKLDTINQIARDIEKKLGTSGISSIGPVLDEERRRVAKINSGYDSGDWVAEGYLPENPPQDSPIIELGTILTQTTPEKISPELWQNATETAMSVAKSNNSTHNVRIMTKDQAKKFASDLSSNKMTDRQFVDTFENMAKGMGEDFYPIMRRTFKDGDIPESYLVALFFPDTLTNDNWVGFLRQGANRDKMVDAFRSSYPDKNPEAAINSAKSRNYDNTRRMILRTISEKYGANSQLSATIQSKIGDFMDAWAIKDYLESTVPDKKLKDSFENSLKMFTDKNHFIHSDGSVPTVLPKFLKDGTSFAASDADNISTFRKLSKNPNTLAQFVDPIQDNTNMNRRLSYEMMVAGGAWIVEGKHIVFKIKDRGFEYTATKNGKKVQIPIKQAVKIGPPVEGEVGSVEQFIRNYRVETLKSNEGKLNVPRAGF